MRRDFFGFYLFSFDEFENKLQRKNQRVFLPKKKERLREDLVHVFSPKLRRERVLSSRPRRQRRLDGCTSLLLFVAVATRAGRLRRRPLHCRNFRSKLKRQMPADQSLEGSTDLLFPCREGTLRRTGSCVTVVSIR